MARNPIPAGRYEALTGKKAANISQVQVDFGSEVEERSPEQAMHKHMTSILKGLPDDSVIHLLGDVERQRSSFYQRKGFKVEQGIQAQDSSVEVAVINFKDFLAKEKFYIETLKHSQKLVFIFEDLSLFQAVERMKKYSSWQALKSESCEKNFRSCTVMLFQAR